MTTLESLNGELHVVGKDESTARTNGGERETDLKKLKSRDRGRRDRKADRS